MTTTADTCSGCGTALYQLPGIHDRPGVRRFHDLGPGIFTVGGETGSDGHCYLEHSEAACQKLADMAAAGQP